MSPLGFRVVFQLPNRLEVDVLEFQGGKRWYGEL
jgi:hypothetical protein